MLCLFVWWCYCVVVWCLDVLFIEWEVEVGLVLMWCFGIVGVWVFVYLGKGGGDSGYVWGWLSGVGVLLVLFVGWDLVFWVGVGGVFWVIFVGVEKREKEMGREFNFWEGWVCFWDGVGLDGWILLCVCVGYFLWS